MRSLIPLFATAFLASAPALATELVQVGPFRSVELRGGGDVSFVPGPVQRVTLLNGSTQLTSFRVRGDGGLEITTDCHNDCPHNYNLQIRIESPQVLRSRSVPVVQSVLAEASRHSRTFRRP